VVDLKMARAEMMREGRLLSLDVFYGITIAMLVLVNSPGTERAYTQLSLSQWNGCTLCDLVFAFFVFIVGVSLAFSLPERLERGECTSDLLGEVLRRSSVIFGLGLLLNGFPYDHLSTIRIPGVLQRIALCYLFAGALFLFTKARSQAWIAAGLLIVYWLVNTQIPYLSDLSQDHSLAGGIDRLLLSESHMYLPEYDPEGIMSTLPAIATALMGSLTGAWLLSNRPMQRKVWGMVAAGTVCAAAGWIWSKWFPINKWLWTSSYVLWTAGLALYVLAFCYWSIEIKGWRRWCRPFEVFGLNAIAVYFITILFLKIQKLIHIPRLDGTPGDLHFYITEHLFGWTSPQNASLIYALGYTLLWLAVFWALYRRRIHIKI
jgi:predicted acyltransferase